MTESIADRWTKKYNECNDTLLLDTDGASNELQIFKTTSSRKHKLSQHQKYREMMMVCKELCDISSDLPIKEFKGVLKFIKDAKDMIRNGKAVIVKEVGSFHDGEDESDCGHEIVQQDLDQFDTNSAL